MRDTIYLRLTSTKLVKGAPTVMTLSSYDGGFILGAIARACEASDEFSKVEMFTEEPQEKPMEFR